jgi:hypothetical protein
MRTIDKTSIATSGRVINIYKVEGLAFNPQKIFVNHYYEVVYKLGSSEGKIRSMYLYSTADYRTLVFISPHKEAGEIGIPSMNIISIDPVA